MAEALKMKVDTAGEEAYESYNLPDVRDGLTPRQRRILWAMYKRKLSSRSQFEKTACTFLDAGGTYGVDGEMSDHWGFGEADIIDDAIAQMTQHFNAVALIEAGRGNFGQHGGSPASPRFTEIRINSFAEDSMLKHLRKKTVAFQEDPHIVCGQVPVVLPSCIPGSIVLGADVIADGFYSQIPPHNLGEVIDAMVAMINNPDLAPEQILDYIKGPDFITGGVIVNKSELPEMYRTGRGQIRIRGQAHVEPPEGRKRKSNLVYTQIPFGMDRDMDAFVKLIQDLIRYGELPGVICAFERHWLPNVEIVFELRADADIQEVQKLLWLKTDLEMIVDYQAILLSERTPCRMSLHNILSEHLAFYRDFLQKKNGTAPTAEEMCQELLAIKKKYAKPRRTEIIDLV